MSSFAILSEMDLIRANFSGWNLFQCIDSSAMCVRFWHMPNEAKENHVFFYALKFRKHV